MRVDPAYAPRKPKSYYKQSVSVTKKRSYNPFMTLKDETLDCRFWNQFHLDFYTSVDYRVKKPQIAPMQAIDWDHIANLKKGICDLVIDACEAYGIKELMGF